MNRRNLTAACLLAFAVWCLHGMEQAGRAQAPVYPEPWTGDYCEGLPPLLGTDC